MDKEAGELSKAGLRLFSKEMSPEYQRVRELLLGYLASHEVTVELLAKKEVNDIKNIELLSAFTQVLPKARLVKEKLSNNYEREDWKFITSDEYEVRVVQSNSIWLPEDAGTENNTKGTYRPYYLIGRSQSDKEKWLLACAGENDTRKTRKASDTYSNIFLFKPSRGSKDAIQKLNRLASQDYPTPEVMTRIFNPETHTLEISVDSPGSVSARGKGVIEWDVAKPLKRISDEELGAFDVNSHLHRISTALGVESRLNQIISTHMV